MKHFIAFLGLALTISGFGKEVSQEQTLYIVTSILGQLEIRHALLEAEVEKLAKQLPEMNKRCSTETFEEGHQMAMEYQPTIRAIQKRIVALDAEDVQMINHLKLFKPELPKQKNLSQNLAYLFTQISSIQTANSHEALLKDLRKFSYDLQSGHTLNMVGNILSYRLAMEKLKLQQNYLNCLIAIGFIQKEELSQSLSEKVDDFIIGHLRTLSKGKKLSHEQIFQSMETCMNAQLEQMQAFGNLMARFYSLDKRRQELTELIEKVDVQLTPHDEDNEQVLLNKATNSLKTGRYDNAINCFERYKKIRKEPGGAEFCASAIAMVRAVRDQKHNASLMVFQVPKGIEKFGIRCGDFIIALNDTPIHSANQYMQYRDILKDTSVTITILRLDANGIFQTIKMPFKSFPRGFYICDIIPE